MFFFFIEMINFISELEFELIIFPGSDNQISIQCVKCAISIDNPVLELPVEFFPVRET